MERDSMERTDTHDDGDALRCLERRAKRRLGRWEWDLSMERDLVERRFQSSD